MSARIFVHAQQKNETGKPDSHFIVFGLIENKKFVVPISQILLETRKLDIFRERIIVSGRFTDRISRSPPGDYLAQGFKAPPAFHSVPIDCFFSCRDEQFLIGHLKTVD
jgi:hypothetical protein